MNYTTTILEIVQYAVPSLISAGIVYLFLKQNEKMERIKMQAVLMEKNNAEINPIRLQAYERMTLFLERISPNSLVMRLRQPDMHYSELHQLLLMSIRQEFEHNLSQQLYVSSNTWQMICLTKDQIINDINRVSAEMNNESNGMDFSKALMQFYIEKDEPMPTQRCLDIVKNEFNTMFG